MQDAAGRQYTDNDLNDLPKINEDGSVDSPELVSVEDAEKLAGGEVNPREIELDPEPEPAKKLDGAPKADEEPDPEKKGIELDAEAAAKESITVGGVTKTKEEWLAETAEYAGVNLEGVPEETQQKLLEMYIDHKHKDAWQKANTAKAEENARSRREVEAERRQIESRKQQLKNREQTLLKQQEALKALATKEITENDVYDGEGRLNVMKQRELHKVLDAREKLPEIEQELKQNQQEMAQAEIDRTLAEAEALIATHPELQLAESQSLRDAIDRYEKGEKRTHDGKIVFNLYKVIDLAKDYGLSIEDAYQELADEGRLTVTATKPNALQPTKSKTGAEQMAAQVARKQAGTKFINPDGTGQARLTPNSPKQSMGDKLREASARASGVSKNSKLQDIGY